jgi:hypothetical protein
MNMSTITGPIDSYDDALDFLPRTEQKPPRRGIVATLRIFAQAMSEGLAAERRYHELTVHGVAPDKAAAQVLNEHYSGR